MNKKWRFFFWLLSKDNTGCDKKKTGTQVVIGSWHNAGVHCICVCVCAPSMLPGVACLKPVIQEVRGEREKWIQARILGAALHVLGFWAVDWWEGQGQRQEGHIWGKPNLEKVIELAWWEQAHITMTHNDCACPKIAWWGLASSSPKCMSGTSPSDKLLLLPCAERVRS